MTHHDDDDLSGSMQRLPERAPTGDETFADAPAGLPLGGAEGGADSDPDSVGDTDAMSALKMSQLDKRHDALGLPPAREEDERRFSKIATPIHERQVDGGRRDDGRVGDARGADVRALRRVADAMVERGVT